MKVLGFVVFVLSLLIAGGTAFADPLTMTIHEPQNTTYYTDQNITWYVTTNFVADTWVLCFNELGCVVIGINSSNATSAPMTYPVSFYKLNFTANTSGGDLVSSAVYFTVLVRPTSIGTTLTEAGEGLGNLLDKTRDPLVNLILGLGFVAGMVVIVLAVAYAFYHLGRKSVAPRPQMYQ